MDTTVSLVIIIELLVLYFLVEPKCFRNSYAKFEIDRIILICLNQRSNQPIYCTNGPILTVEKRRF